MTNNKLIFLDTETTGRGPDDRLIQVCYKHSNLPPFTSFFKAPVPIKFEAMAVHHITEEMIKDAKPFIGNQDIFYYLTDFLKEGILVAHNAPFDIEMLKHEGVEVKQFIDTLKVAQFLFDEPLYKLQYLRYKFGIKIEGKAHDAEGDVAVLEALFNYLFSIFPKENAGTTDDAIIERMEYISTQPILLRRMPFGKHKGKTFGDLVGTEKDYLQWLNKQADIDKDLKHTLNHYLKPKTTNQTALKI